MTDLVLGLTSSPYTAALPWNPGFGTAYASPVTLPTGLVDTIRRPPSNLATQDLLMSGFGVGSIPAYAFTPGVGYGAQYGTYSPGGLPTGAGGGGVGLAPQTATAVFASSGSRSGGSVTPALVHATHYTPGTGFGATYSNATMASDSTSNFTGPLDVDPGEAAVVVGYHTALTNLLIGFPWTSASGFGTRYTDASPALPAAAPLSVRISPTRGAAAVHHSSGGSGRNVTAYAFSAASGFGAKYSDPTGYVLGSLFGVVAFSPRGDYVATGNNVSPFIQIYAWTDATGFGAKVSNPSTLPPADVAHAIGGIQWTADGTTILMTSGASPNVAGYAWAAGFGAKYADPSVSPGPADGIALPSPATVTPGTWQACA